MCTYIYLYIIAIVLAWTVVTEYHRLGSFNSRCLFFIALETVKFKIKMLADLVVGEGSTWLADGHHIDLCSCDRFSLHLCDLSVFFL